MHNDSASTQATLKDTAKSLLGLGAEMDRREKRFRDLLNQELGSLRAAVTQTRHEVASIVNGAGAKITQEAQQAATRVAAQYDRDVSATSARLREASRTVWMWFGAAGSILLLVLLVGWAVVGYYRKELAASKEELARYENAIPVVKAFYASDVVICGDRVCVNVDPNGQKIGDKRQYRQAKPRPQPGSK